MKKIRERMRVKRAVRQLMNQNNNAKGTIMIRTKEGFVCVNGGKIGDIGLVMAIAAKVDATGYTRKAILDVADMIRDIEKENKDENLPENQEQKSDEKDTHQVGDKNAKDKD